MLGIFEKFDVMVDPRNVEDCHWIKSGKVAKKVIVNFLEGRTLTKYVY